MSASVDQALAALPSLSLEELRAEWEKLHRSAAPELPVDLLRRGIAFRLQERMQGGLPGTTKRQLAPLVRQLDRTGAITATREVEMKVGARLVREWQGVMHHVLVVDDGFLFEDRKYTSLSKIAADITGVNWSGPRFFGLKAKKLPRNGSHG